jgi:hypothetical protein
MADLKLCIPHLLKLLRCLIFGVLVASIKDNHNVPTVFSKVCSSQQRNLA